MRENTNKNKEKVWNSLFKMNEKVFRKTKENEISRIPIPDKKLDIIKNKFMFNYMISTDGIGASLIFVNDNIK